MLPWFPSKHIFSSKLPKIGLHFELPCLFHFFTSFTTTTTSFQSCPTLCDPIDGSPPGSAIPGILQARTLGWVAISFSIAWKWKVKVKSLSHVRLVATPWTAAHQTLAMYKWIFEWIYYHYLTQIKNIKWNNLMW